MRSEAELAGALAQEVAHVVQKHQLKAHQKKLKGNALFAIGGAVVDANAKTGALGNEVIKIGIGEAKSMILLSLDRGEEYQADRMAWCSLPAPDMPPMDCRRSYKSCKISAPNKAA